MTNRPGDDSLTLAIETSNPSAHDAAHGRAGSVVLGRFGAPGARPPLRLLGIERLRPTARHDDALMPAIDALCRRARVQPRDIGRVAVSVGPGGFTGLRIAVATAKLIAEAVGAETTAVPSTVVAALARRRLGRFAVALAGKRDTAWLAFFDGAPAGVTAIDGAEAGRLMNAASLEDAHRRLGLRAIVADRHFPEALRTWAAGAGVPVVAPWFSAARCLEASAGRPPVDPLALAPLYPREPEAVSKWRERAPG